MRSLWDILVFMTEDKPRKIWGYHEEKYTIIDSPETHAKYMFL